MMAVRKHKIRGWIADVVSKDLNGKSHRIIRQPKINSEEAAKELEIVLKIERAQIEEHRKKIENGEVIPNYKKEKQKQYYKKNRERLLKQNAEYAKTPQGIESQKKRNASPQRKMTQYCRHLLKRILLNNNDIHTINLIEKLCGYTPENLINHIESLFKPWMNWNNQGKYNPETHSTNPTWQLGHKLALALLTNLDNPHHPNWKLAMALDNLFPQDAKENIELNSKLTPDGFDIICNSGISWIRPNKRNKQNQ